ncbi:MAG: tripartite tricarboxylate transporter substrate binding protein [Limnohabitans sp.]|nr:tripartite tricarboxylate transporter substrate binding protein [Limnohabitans sp.]
MPLSKPLAAFVLAIILPLCSMAQQFPSKPVRIIVPYAVGGVGDYLARVVGDALSKKWSQPVIIENKVGAAGNIGTDLAARAPADGYTILYVASQHAAAPALFKNPGFALSDFSAITITSQTRMGLIVNSQFKANTVSELVSFAKANPGKVNAGTVGPSSIQNTWLVTFEQATATKMLPVPYKGSGAAHPDLLAGQIDLMFDAASIVMPHIKAGKLKLLAMGGSGRSPFTPNTPTLEELGYPVGKSMVSWNAFLVPNKTPASLVARLHQDITQVLLDTEVRAKFEKVGVEMVASSSAEADALIISEGLRLARFYREIGVLPE